MKVKYCETCEKEISCSNWSKHINTKGHKVKCGEIEIRPKVYKCSFDDCEFETKSCASFSNHKRIYHLKPIHKYHCELCKVNLKDDTALIIHRAKFDTKSKSWPHIEKVRDANPDKFCTSLLGKPRPITNQDASALRLFGIRINQ